MNISKLQYDNRTILTPSRDSFVAFDIPHVYHVTTSGSHGTVTATPSEGVNGTVVTLSNTPDSGYIFSSYTVTGATLYNTNKFVINGSDVNVVGNFTKPAYKRYLWKFTGATGRLGWKQFQIAAIKVNDISLPYTYITSGISAGSTWSDSSPGNFVDSNESNKWGGGTTASGTIDGWYIFDLPSAVIPTKYSLKTGNDTNYEDRNPRNGMLYGSLGTPTTTSDSSWVLLDSRALNLPRSNLVWTSYTLNKV